MRCHDTNIRTSYNNKSKQITDVIYNVTIPGSRHVTPGIIMQITNVVYDVTTPGLEHVTLETITV